MRGEEGKKVGSGPGRAARSTGATNLQNPGGASLPARPALGPQGPGETGWGGAGRAEAGPGGRGGARWRSSPWAEPGGTCGRWGRVAGARPGRAAPAAAGALVYQHTCVLFLTWNVGLAERLVRGAARVGGGTR